MKGLTGFDDFHSIHLNPILVAPKSIFLVINKHEFLGES
jgi:hypothetical protein